MFNFVKVGAADAPYVKGHLPSVGASESEGALTQSEGVSETSASSRAKTNLSTIDFYADLCFARPGETFSV